MLGTWINVGTVVAGALAGRAVGGRLPEAAQSTLVSVLGCVTIMLGVENALRRPSGYADAPVAAQAGFFLVVLVSLLSGALLGEWWHIEDGLQNLGQWAEKRLNAGGGTFGAAFVSTSLLFCAGPLTILGCIADGLRGDYTLLATKAVLDGFASVAFAAAMGWGVLLSAVTVLVVQGTLALSAGVLAAWMSPVMMDALTAAGGIILVALGIRLLDLKDIRVGNLIPALLLAPLLIALWNAAWPLPFSPR